MTAPLRIGLAFPHGTYALPGAHFSWETVRGLAQDLETAGFRALWVSDHYFADFEAAGGPPGTSPQLDALVLLPALAVVTRRVALGTLVLAVGFRYPSVLAKAAASLDRLSGGRFELGLGAGWRSDEYRAAGLPFPGPGERLAQLEEAISLIRVMLKEDPATFRGDRFEVEDAPNLPHPARPDLPILVAAFGPRARTLAAARADSWNVAWRFDPAGYGELAARFDQACAAVGRDPAAVGRSVGLLTLAGESGKDLERRFAEWRGVAPWAVGDASLEEMAARGLIGTPEQIIERIEQFRERGMTDLVMNFAPVPFGWSAAAGWDIVAEEVLPTYAEAPR